MRGWRYIAFNNNLACTNFFAKEFLVQAVLLSSSFVRDAFRGILRARVLSAEGLRGAGMAGAVAVGVPI